MIVIVTSLDAGERIDHFLAKKFPKYSRNYFINLIQSGNITLYQRSIKPSYKVKTTEVISIDFVQESTKKPKAEKIDLDIIFENNDVIVVNKPVGMVVHPANGSPNGTLVNALLAYFPAIKDAVLEKGNTLSEARAGIVHRLDKDTSGIIIVAKNVDSMRFLSSQIREKAVRKIYWALCFGWPKKENGTIVSYLGRHPENRKTIANIGSEKGREAISDYRVLEYLTSLSGEKLSLVEFSLHTGRTHQIRVQAKSINNPILGDKTYYTKESEALSKELQISRQLLHAKQLTILLPEAIEPETFDAPVPEDFQTILDKSKEI